MEFWQSKKGLYSLEIIISIAFFTLMATGVFVLLGSSIAESGGLIQRARARAVLMEGIDVAESIANQDWDLFVSGVYGLSFDGSTWAFDGTKDTTAGNFVREVTVVNGGDNLAEVSVNITWNFLGRVLAMSSTTMLSNWSSLEVWGDWGNPIIAGSLDIGPQGRATSLVYEDSVVYLTSEVSSGNVPTFFTIDVTDQQTPVILDSIQVSSDLFDLVKIPGTTYIFAVGDKNNSELMLFDVSDPNSIVLADNFALPDEGVSISIDATTMFVGTKDGLEIYDVTNPVSPNLLGSYDADAQINDIFKKDSYLYLATDDRTKDVIILSITDLANPSLAGSIDVPESVDALSVAVRGVDLYVGLDSNSSTKPELYQYDRTNPTNPTLVTTLDIGGSINKMVLAGEYIYLATGNNNQEFQVFSKQPNLQFIVGLNMSQVATSITFEENTIYTTLRSNDALQIIQAGP